MNPLSNLNLDPNTVRWLKENMDPVFGYPRLIRFSWSTTSKLLETHGVQCEWPEDIEPDQQTLKFTKGTGKVFKRPTLFSNMGLSHVSQF